MRMTKVHKIVLYIVDHDNVGVADVKTLLEEQRYPNHCISPRVLAIDTREVDWYDDLAKQPNHTATAVAELFSKPQS